MSDSLLQTNGFYFYKKRYLEKARFMKFNPDGTVIVGWGEPRPLDEMRKWLTAENAGQDGLAIGRYELNDRSLKLFVKGPLEEIYAEAVVAPAMLRMRWHNCQSGAEGLRHFVIIEFDEEVQKPTSLFGRLFKPKATVAKAASAISQNSVAVPSNAQFRWDVVTILSRDGEDESTSAIHSVDVEQDAKFVITTEGRDVVLWNFDRREVSRTFVNEMPSGAQGDRIPVETCLSRNAQRLAAAYGDNQVFVWDVATGTQVFWAGASVSNPRIAVDPKGSVLIITGDSTLTDNLVIHKIPSKRADGPVRFPPAALFSIKAPEGIRALGCSPDGKHFATANHIADKSIRVWDFSTGEQTLSLEGRANAVAFSPDGRRLATVNMASSLTVWDLATKRLVFAKHGTEKYDHQRASCVTYAPNGKVIASSAKDGVVRFWNAETGAILQTVQLLEADFASEIRKIVFARNGKYLLTANGDCTTCVLDVSELLSSSAEVPQPDATQSEEMLKVHCACGARYKASRRKLGTAFSCKSCGAKLIVQ